MEDLRQPAAGRGSEITEENVVLEDLIQEFIRVSGDLSRYEETGTSYRGGLTTKSIKELRDAVDKFARRFVNVVNKKREEERKNRERALKEATGSI